MLSTYCKNVIRKGLANKVAGNELIAAVDGFPAGAIQATNVPPVGALTTAGTAIGALSTVSAAIGALATVSAPIGAFAGVGTGAVDVACALAADVDDRVDEIQEAFDAQITEIDARITTLQAAFDAQIAQIDARVTTLQEAHDATLTGVDTNDTLLQATLDDVIDVLVVSDLMAT